VAKVIATCKTNEKSTRKEATVEAILKENYGFAGDVHADCHTDRQASLLAIESINKMRELGFDVSPGDFAENLTTQGLEPTALPPGTLTSIGRSIILEITQIGRECDGRCAIYRQIGECIVSREGVFTRVIRGGFVRAGDRIMAGTDG